MKFILIILILLFIGCISDQKEEISDILYKRITDMIVDANGYKSSEWCNIKENIKSGKDTAFLIQNQDFMILVTVRHDIIKDTLITKSTSYSDSIKDSSSTNRGTW